MGSQPWSTERCQCAILSPPLLIPHLVIQSAGGISCISFVVAGMITSSIFCWNTMAPNQMLATMSGGDLSHRLRSFSFSLIHSRLVALLSILPVDLDFRTEDESLSSSSKLEQTVWSLMKSVIGTDTPLLFISLLCQNGETPLDCLDPESPDWELVVRYLVSYPLISSIVSHSSCPPFRTINNISNLGSPFILHWWNPRFPNHCDRWPRHGGCWIAPIWFVFYQNIYSLRL